MGKEIFRAMISSAAALVFVFVGTATANSASEKPDERALQKAIANTEKIHNPTYRAYAQANLVQQFYLYQESIDNTTRWSSYTHALYKIDASKATAEFQSDFKAHVEAAEKALEYHEKSLTSSLRILSEGTSALDARTAERSKSMRDFERTWAEIEKAGKKDQSTRSFNGEDTKTALFSEIRIDADNETARGLTRRCSERRVGVLGFWLVFPPAVAELGGVRRSSTLMTKRRIVFLSAGGLAVVLFVLWPTINALRVRHAVTAALQHATSVRLDEFAFHVPLASVELRCFVHARLSLAVLAPRPASTRRFFVLPPGMSVCYPHFCAP